MDGGDEFFFSLQGFEAIRCVGYTGLDEKESNYDDDDDDDDDGDDDDGGDEAVETLVRQQGQIVSRVVWWLRCDELSTRGDVAMTFPEEMTSEGNK